MKKGSAEKQIKIIKKNKFKFCEKIKKKKKKTQREREIKLFEQ
jgi:hypothetical protein